MSLEIKKSALWYETYQALNNTKYVIHQGGSSSGKTYNIVDCLMYICCTKQNVVITITGPNFPALMRGAVRDCMSIWGKDEFYKKMLSQPNQNGCRCPATNSVIEFATFYNVEVSKGSKRDYLFINECTAVPYEISWELMARTKQNVILDFNPTSRFWVHEKFEGRNDAKWIFSTHKANHFIPESIHRELEALKDTDPERYKVYCLGQCGKTDGLIYQNWVQCSELPETYSRRIFGLDFGFTNDPTTLIEIRYVNGELYAKEHIYKTGLTNQDIAKIIKDLGFAGETIICDSAEKKSVEELRRAGIINAKPCVKGPGSINQGIQLVKSMKLNITADSLNTKVELMNYRWATDLLGKFGTKPLDNHFDHCLDALRYGVQYMFNKPKTNTFVGGW